MSTQQPLGWGPPTQPPPPKTRKPWHRRWWVWALAAFALLVAAAALAGDPNQEIRTAPTTAPAPTVAENEDAGADTAATDESTTTAPQAPGQLRLGQSGTVTDQFGEDLFDITIRGSKQAPTRPLFSRGDEFNKPEHGAWMGVFVKITARQDAVDNPWGDELYARVGGRHYSSDACCPEGFGPTLDYVTLSDGESTEGWLLFDVPAGAKGEVILRETTNGDKIASWRF